MTAVTPREVDGAFCWQAGFAVDADGSPRAYCSKESGLEGLDYLANAGHPGNWYGLVCDPMGEPIVQGPDDLAAGYFVSATALVDHAKSSRDPARYVDSSAIPYIAVPPELRHLGVKLGDVCIVVYGKKRCGAVVGDVSPHSHYGEGSIALAEALGIPSSPKNGGVESGVAYVVFPSSTQGWPRTAGEIQVQAKYLFDEWGGSDKFTATFGFPSPTTIPPT